MIISDLSRPFVRKLRQRNDMLPYAPYYIAIALVELTENIEIEELKTTGPLANFVTNIAEYPIQGYDPLGIQGNPFINAVDHKFTFVDNWFIYYDTSGVITPGISMGTNLNKRDLRVVEPMSNILGLPSVFVQHGDKKNKGKILVGQMPDNPYATQMRYQRQHPFIMPFGQVLQAAGDSVACNTLGKSEVYMPDDWSDIITYVAAEKACDDIGLNEIGAQYHQKIFGYKDKKGNDMPGMIFVKQTQQERGTLFNTRALRPVQRRYT